MKYDRHPVEAKIGMSELPESTFDSFLKAAMSVHVIAYIPQSL